IVVASARRNRSTTCIPWPDPRKCDFSVKFVVSTTSVSPSHRPIESPSHWCTLGGRWWPPIRIIRASWFTSVYNDYVLRRRDHLVIVQPEKIRNDRRRNLR